MSSALRIIYMILGLLMGLLLVRMSRGADLVYGALPPVRACPEAAYLPASTPAAWPPVPDPLAFIGPVPAAPVAGPPPPPPLPRAPGTNTWLMERREAFIRRAAAHVRVQGRAPTPVEWPIDKLPLLP